MKHYEYAYLTRQDISEEDAKKIQDDLTAFLKEKGGEIIDSPKSYKKRLAYPIKKQSVAYVNSILFSADSETIAEFKKQVDGVEQILRGLIVAYDPKKLKRESRRERTRLSVNSVEGKQEESAEKQREEETREKPVKDTVSKSAPAEEEKEGKPAEPSGNQDSEEKKVKPQRKKVKAELRDIEQKLDEILK